MTTTDLATYEQAIDFQTRLVRRGILPVRLVHEIDQCEERTEYGSVWIHCSCNRWFSFRTDEADRFERVYAQQHVAAELRTCLAVAA